MAFPASKLGAHPTPQVDVVMRYFVLPSYAFIPCIMLTVVCLDQLILRNRASEVKLFDADFTSRNHYQQQASPFSRRLTDSRSNFALIRWSRGSRVREFVFGRRGFGTDYTQINTWATLPRETAKAVRFRRLSIQTFRLWG